MSGFDISVKTDVEKVMAKFRTLNQAELGKVTSRAINRVIDQARAVAVKEIRKRYNINPKFLKDKIGDKENRYNALKVWKASSKNPTATLKAYGKPIPLIAFPSKQTSEGVEVSVFKGRSQVIKGAFLATMKSGHTSVFGRGDYRGNKFIPRNKRVRKWPKPDNPITRLSTTSVRSAISTPGIISMMDKTVHDKFALRLERDIKFLLSKTP